MNGDWQQQEREKKREARDAAARRKSQKAGRDGTFFLALPMEVLQSDGYRRAAHVSRSLLIDMASNPTRSGGLPMNGWLTASMSALKKLGWKSDDTVSRAVKDLVACGLLHQTRQSRWPNVSALYAKTWERLVSKDGLDLVLVRAFDQGAYKRPEKDATTPQRARTAAATKKRKLNATARQLGYRTAPSNGALHETHGTVTRRADASSPPCDGAEAEHAIDNSTPSDGDYLDIAICIGAARTLMGTLLSRSMPSTRPHPYYATRIGQIGNL